MLAQPEGRNVKNAMVARDFARLCAQVCPFLHPCKWDKIGELSCAGEICPADHMVDFTGHTRVELLFHKLFHSCSKTSIRFAHSILGQRLEPRGTFNKSHLDPPGGAVSLLGDNDFRNPVEFRIIRFIDLFTEYE